MPTRITHASDVPRLNARATYARILDAAQHAFAERGTSVSLAEIARRAGVGTSTVHRCFPTKAGLLEAVLERRIERLNAQAAEHLRQRDPGPAFFDFCMEVVASAPRDEAACDVLTLGDGWPRARIRGAGKRFHQSLTLLLAAAQRSGTVRADITVADVLGVFTACLAVQRRTDQSAPIGRTAALILDSLRAERNSAGIFSAVSGADVDDPDAHGCQMCGVALARSATGRRARYCSPACRQKAHRERTRLARPSSAYRPTA
ncbi:TetR/AcrR family transcriptional regulator [Nocardia tengchongensis]|uniref:TetR/AcrR family transcriptional regulator n=1 Tax=Nocardia tengchongensis TaxID=2055889 RepID=A0ABX8CQ19_9NOCA|nr:TetR/AcrR family transcriptional regulator [Nocardia tengchongensis]QVI20979.1 TetR/AcrR family transcriptional regulator [Nocardia tengchongensis]